MILLIINYSAQLTSQDGPRMFQKILVKLRLQHSKIMKQDRAFLFISLCFDFHPKFISFEPYNRVPRFDSRGAERGRRWESVEYHHASYDYDTLYRRLTFRPPATISYFVRSRPFCT